MDAVLCILQSLHDYNIRSPDGKEKWTKTTVGSILRNEKYKGDARLQKKFTVDFLEKKMKPNEGEVPQYYVEDSHPHIIEPEEWDHVQAMFDLRKALGKTYSGKSMLSAKLVCEDCSGFFGSKVCTPQTNTAAQSGSATASSQTRKGVKPQLSTPVLFSGCSSQPITSL